MRVRFQHKNSTKEIAESNGGSWFEPVVIDDVAAIPREGDTVTLSGEVRTVEYVSWHFPRKRGEPDVVVVLR